MRRHRDILIWGATEVELDENLIKAVDRMRGINLKLKWDKRKFKVKESDMFVTL